MSADQNSKGKPARVRFAPSPTGYLHIGGARTALYNWLWARRTGGEFILRIEDTDRERSTESSVQAILDSMRWLGLDWDEGPGKGGEHGPYFQMDRLGLYREHADKLIEMGKAYRCYATKEELEAERERQRAAGNPFFRYPGWWRDKGPSEWPEGQPYVVRLKAPMEGSTCWEDRVKGLIEVPHSEIQDVVLVRQDGVPLYNFGCFVDDLTMGITLVARGDDHVINTPIQLLLYQALGVPAPEMAHLPMIHGPDGKKLSKRHAAVSTMDYAEQGYLPDAMVNYLARLGWSHGDEEIFSREELIAAFDWENVGRSPARYDAQKLAHVQGTHLRGLSKEALAQVARPFVEQSGLSVDFADPRYPEAVEAVQLRATLLTEIPDMISYFFAEPEMDEKAAKKWLKAKSLEPLQKLIALLREQEAFDRASLEAAITAWMEAEELGMKDFAQAARVAMSGRSATPGLYAVMEVLGKERVLARLERGATLILERAAAQG